MPHDLIDIGANLAHDSFDDDRADVLARAVAAGVTRLIVTGSSDASNLAALELARLHSGQLYSTAGVHPHHAADYDRHSDAAIRTLVADRHCVAVGECGLDYFRNLSPRDAQIRAFEAQLQIAIDTQMPVFLHQRDAHDDFVKILQPRLADITRAVAHCFTGEGESLREYLEMDLYIGITGWICDERRGTHLKEVVPDIPDERLMIETDAPYLMPRTIRPKPKTRRNEPMYLTEVATAVAEARNQTTEQVASLTTANAIRFFGLDQFRNGD